MNEIMKDIDDLRVVQRGISSGVDKELTLEFINKIIEFKKIQVSTFEQHIEKDFTNGSNCS